MRKLSHSALKPLKGLSWAKPAFSRVGSLHARFFADEAPGAPSDRLKFSLIIPSRAIINNQPVISVSVPGSQGDFGIFPGHVATISELRPGVVAVDKGTGEPEKYFVSGGFAFIHKDSTCHINAVEAVPVSELDGDRAREELARSEERVNSAQTDEDRAVAMIGLELHRSIVGAVTGA
eukprot:TRINITY_DN49195_c0_g2_i1.p1 TRINITY_DN49195_c0_g2~~TRINITY_DN49195_c0_g2_i1.p1  ORF type:complete len:178 (+),score=32.38 TRINITY_DN49195_c0_g2_i1:48-581(+)